MSTVRFMSHTDVGAPDYLPYDRTFLYNWLETVLTKGYNTRFVNNITRNGKTLTVNYSEPHGYVEGRLLALENSSYDALNGLHRVIGVPTESSLQFFIKDEDFAAYPEILTDIDCTTKVAPFNWEIVYKSSEQISFKSRRTDSSKVVVTVKKPTYPFHATALKTTNAVAYEMDFSKDINTENGLPIDSCLNVYKQQYNHSSMYWLCTSNSESLQDAANWNNSVYRGPWTLVGDDKFIYIITNPFVESLYENSSYRTYSVQTYNNNYNSLVLWSFGDYNPIDTTEYSTGSSFFFNFHYYANNNNRSTLRSSQIDSYNYSPFIRTDSWYTKDSFFFSGYDPKGYCDPAAIMTGGYVPYASHPSGGSSYLYPSYPDRISGGFVYYDYLAYSRNIQNISNNSSVFYKGVFPHVKCLATNMINYSNIARGTHLKVFKTEEPFRQFITVFAGGNGYHGEPTGGFFLFELD